MSAHVTCHFPMSESEACLFGYNTLTIPTVTHELGFISNNRQRDKRKQ